MSKRKYESYMVMADDGSFEPFVHYKDAFASYNRELKNGNNPMLCGVPENGDAEVILAK
jgi:hypothetical protein